MKKNTLFFVCLLMLVMVVSCKKENGDKYFLNARMSNFQTSKAYIDNDKYSCFRSGEEIRVNNQTCTVAPNAQDENHTCGIANVTESQNGYYAFYPAELLSGTPDISSSSKLANATVILPQRQDFTYENGHQVINNPMAGHLSGSSGTIPLHNLCALLKITVKATTSATISSIDVTLKGTTIWGTGTVNESNWELVMDAQQDHSTVTLSFGANGRQGNPNGETYYIVVPKSTVEVDATNSIQVRINGSNLDNELHTTKTYKIALANGDDRVVAKNTIRTLPYVNIGYQMNYNTKCVFTVNAQGKKVTFAHANLMCGDRGTNTPVQYRNKWLFPGGPYDGMANDQFSYHHEYSNSLVGSNINSDWGWVNEIITQMECGTTPPHTWRVPTKEEWNYMLFDNTNPNRTNRFVKALVNGHRGLIIFPDGWSPKNNNDPYKKFKNLESGNYVSRINQTNKDYYTNYNTQNITPTEWTTLKSEGCVFLLAYGNSSTGYSRQNNHDYPSTQNEGYYATANASDYCMKFNSSNVKTDESKSSTLGVCVRLVHDLN